MPVTANLHFLHTSAWLSFAASLQKPMDSAARWLLFLYKHIATHDHHVLYSITTSHLHQEHHCSGGDHGRPSRDNARPHLSFFL